MSTFRELGVPQQLAAALEKRGIIMTAPKAIAFYLATVVLSIVAAAITRSIGERFPMLNMLTLGIAASKKK